MYRFPPELLKTFAALAFQRVGVPEGDARTVAELMIEADLQGADGHGIFRLPQYVRRIQAGGVGLPGMPGLPGLSGSGPTSASSASARRWPW